MRLREIKLGVEVNIKNRKSIGKTFKHLIGQRGNIFDVVLDRGKIETVAVRFFKRNRKNEKTAKVYYFEPSELTFVHSSREKMKAIKLIKLTKSEKEFKKAVEKNQKAVENSTTTSPLNRKKKQITHVAVNLKEETKKQAETIVNRPRQMGKNTELRKELEKKAVFSVESFTKPKNEKWVEVMVLRDIGELFKANHNDTEFFKNIVIHDYENKKDFRMIFEEITQPMVKPVEEKPKKSNLRKIIFIELFIAYILFLAILLN